MRAVSLRWVVLPGFGALGAAPLGGRTAVDPRLRALRALLPPLSLRTILVPCAPAGCAALSARRSVDAAAAPAVAPL